MRQTHPHPLLQDDLSPSPRGTPRTAICHTSRLILQLAIHRSRQGRNPFRRTRDPSFPPKQEPASRPQTPTTQTSFSSQRTIPNPGSRPSDQEAGNLSRPAGTIQAQNSPSSTFFLPARLKPPNPVLNHEKQRRYRIPRPPTSELDTDSHGLDTDFRPIINHQSYQPSPYRVLPNFTRRSETTTNEPTSLSACDARRCDRTSILHADRSSSSRSRITP